LVIAAEERPQLLLADRMNKRIGVTVHEPPLGVVASEHQRHTQRQVLLRQAADLAVLTLDHRQSDDLARWGG
jgi:hypothetical protein